MQNQYFQSASTPPINHYTSSIDPSNHVSLSPLNAYQTLPTTIPNSLNLILSPPSPLPLSQMYPIDNILFCCLFIAIIIICYYLFNHRPKGKPTPLSSQHNNPTSTAVLPQTSVSPSDSTKIKFIPRIDDHVRIIKNFGCDENSFEDGKSLLQKAQELIEGQKIDGYFGSGRFTDDKRYSHFYGKNKYDDDVINFLNKVFVELQKIVFDDEEFFQWIDNRGRNVYRPRPINGIMINAVNKNNRITKKRGNDWHKDVGKVRSIAFWLIPPYTLQKSTLQAVTLFRHHSYKARDGSSGLGEAIKQDYHPGDLVFCDNSYVQHKNPFDNDEKFLNSIDPANVNHFIQFGISY